MAQTTLPEDRLLWDVDNPENFVPTCEREQFFSKHLGRRRDLIRDHAELLQADYDNAKARGEIPQDHPGDNEVHMQNVYAEMAYEAERLGMHRVAEAREREASLWGGGPNVDVLDEFTIKPRSKEDDSLYQHSELPFEQWHFDEEDAGANLLATPALPTTDWRSHSEKS